MIPLFNNRKEKPRSRALEQAIGLGYQFLAATALFVGGGYYLDQRRGGGVLCTLIGVGLTFVYGGYEVWKIVVILNLEAEKEDEERRRGKQHPEGTA